MSANVVGIIQARLASTRLPNKVLLKIKGKSVLQHVVDRVRAVRHIDTVVVATTTNIKDRAIGRLCMDIGVAVSCGEEEDVLDRYYQAALLFKAQHIVRITADCPLIDPTIIDQVILLHLNSSADYTSNILKPTYPDGEDVEVFTLETLEKMWKLAKLPSEREHVTSYIRDHPKLFHIAHLQHSLNLSNKRWTLDHAEDLNFIKKIYQALYSSNPLFGINDIIGVLQTHPDWEKINQHITKNAGYILSLQKDALCLNRNNYIQKPKL